MRFTPNTTSTTRILRRLARSAQNSSLPSPPHQLLKSFITTTTTMAPSSSPWPLNQPVSRPLFTDLVIKCMRKRFPEELADRAWDNTGLLLDNIVTQPPRKPVVLLTNDLDSRVADEALAKGAGVVVTYHPIIFRGLKSVTLADPQQTTLLKLARAGVAVYSPHTAVDASPYGLNTWLANIVAGPTLATTRVIKPIPAASLPAGDEFAGAGYGRVGEMAALTSLAEILHRLALHLGVPSEPRNRPRRLMVARPRGGPHPKTLAEVPVRSFAVCAGSGSDVLAGAGDVDLWVTGEVSHHVALKAVEEGRIVVTVFHSNSERQFLRQQLQPWLEAELRREVDDAQVLVSDEDEDPFRIVDLDADGVSATEHLF